MLSIILLLSTTSYKAIHQGLNQNHNMQYHLPLPSIKLMSAMMLTKSIFSICDWACVYSVYTPSQIGTPNIDSLPSVSNTLSSISISEADVYYALTYLILIKLWDWYQSHAIMDYFTACEIIKINVILQEFADFIIKSSERIVQ